jgi:hypothetical protein
MPHQVALTLAAHVRSKDVERLDAVLRTMGDGVANGSVIDFDSFEGVHFARLVLVPASDDLKGRRLQALLIYMSDLDVSVESHLADLVDRASSGVDELFGMCEGYPGPDERTREERLGFLRQHRLKESAFYVNTIGRTRTQVRHEAELREKLEHFLDSASVQGNDASEVSSALRAHVASDDSLAWALKRPPGLDLSFRIRELCHMVGVPVLLLLLSPLLLLAAPFFLVALRLHELRDPAPHRRPSTELVQELSALEDHLVQNPFTAIGFVKPGMFRRMTLTGVLFAIDYATRHIFNRGNLAGVKTIHFARWVFLDGGRRVIFASNYDGSLESYMDDFIDKIAFGLNVVFSNGYGYPRTRWLVADGANDELFFKDYLRLHQIPTRVWFSAYGRLTSLNITTNERIRLGVSGRDSSGASDEWLRAL